jgi:hypothetical protein
MILANIVDNCVTSSSITSTVIRYCRDILEEAYRCLIGETPFTVCSTLKDPKGHPGQRNLQIAEYIYIERLSFMTNWNNCGSKDASHWQERSGRGKCRKACQKVSHCEVLQPFGDALGPSSQQNNSFRSHDLL